MKPKRINQKIIEIEGQLRWPVKKISTETQCEITSDPWSRAHTILWATKNPREIEYLHELAHAMLAERHHLLSTAIFARGIPDESVMPIVFPCRVASDWFADDLLWQWAPEEEGREIQEHAQYMIEIPIERRDNVILYGGGLILAQAMHYLNQKKLYVPRFFWPVINILLAVDPALPSVERKRDLINSLAALTCRERVELVQDDGIDVWKVTR